MPENFLDRLSTRAKNALVYSQKLAESQMRDVGTEHLLYGIIKESSSFASSVVLKKNITSEQIRMEIIKFYEARGKVARCVGMSEELKKILERSAIIAQKFHYPFIGTEHLLFALVDSDNSAQKILSSLEVVPADISKNLLGIFENYSRVPDMMQAEDEGPDEQPEETSGSKTPTLDFFSTDLTAAAMENTIDPVIGREKEIERLIAILNRRNKNNPVLIGEPGVGKTAIVEGLALAIAAKQVPDFLVDKKILSLDLALVIAGSMFRGEFENRIKQIIDEVKNSKNIILFIDELHTIIGAGATTGSLDAANILKPALARGEITVIGATTTSDYKKNIENDPALERRFQAVQVAEPSVAQSVKILTGLRPYYETHHRVKISDDAIRSACELAERYINDRFLPDKAIDLVDETAASMRAKLGVSKDLLNLREIETQIKDLEQEKIKAVLSQDFQKAKNIKLKQDKEQARLEKTKQRIASSDDSNYPVLGEEMIMKTVSKITGIPTEQLATREIKKLIGLEKILRKHIVGQDNVLTKIAETIRRSRTGIASPNRPIGSFLFLGPTGVGKTETAKVLAREVFGSEQSLVRIDMSELMERHNVSRLIGAPAGYVGFEEGGRLTETIRKKPYSVVLFDEIEKAHPDIYNILLQILEEGILTDATGRQVNFKNTVVILTSNIGSEEYFKSGIGFSGEAANGLEGNFSYDKVSESSHSSLKNNIRPELLNRIECVAVFRPLGQQDLRKIIKLELKKLSDRLRAQQIDINVENEVLNFLNQVSQDPRQGARLIRKHISDHIEGQLSDLILAGTIEKPAKLKITANPQNKKRPVVITPKR